jgi:hypothetical protein
MADWSNDVDWSNEDDWSSIGGVEEEAVSIEITFVGDGVW